MVGPMRVNPGTDTCDSGESKRSSAGGCRERAGFVGAILSQIDLTGGDSFLFLPT